MVISGAACARPAYGPPVGTAIPPAEPAIASLPPSGNLDPTTPLTPEQQRWVDSTLATLTLRDRVGQMTHVWVLGDYTSTSDSTWLEIRDWLLVDKVGGITMSLGTPIEVAVKVNTMQRLANVPLLIASDLEPGLSRLKGGIFAPYLLTAGSATLIPSNMAIGATGRTEDAFEAGRIIGMEGRAVGINVAFAPTVDVNNNPANPVINTRSFGEDPQAVARMSAAFIKGLHSAGMAATPKHFPGHGDTDTDTHLALAVVRSSRARLDSVELVPFRAAIEAGASALMTAHIALPAMGVGDVPATLVPAVIHGLLRDTLKFRGLTFTDAMTMDAVGKGYSVGESSVLAVKAGADILLKPGNIRESINAVVAAVERGEITPARIEASARRSLELKARTGAAFAPYRNLDSLRAVVGHPANWEYARGIAERAVTLLRDRQPQLPIARSSTVLLVTYAPELELEAGRVFAAELGRGARVRSVRIGPQSGAETLDSIAKEAARVDRVVVSTHVRRIEGEGRFAVAQRVSAWIDSVAAVRPLTVVAHGNPYVIRQFPRVGSYMVTYGIDPSLERAAARALLGAIPISGRAPISLPGFFALGDGLSRAAVAAAP
jgi:beta-N-acetylhexosaminidase